MWSQTQVSEYKFRKRECQANKVNKTPLSGGGCGCIDTRVSAVVASKSLYMLTILRLTQLTRDHLQSVQPCEGEGSSS
jgi:hypothetical protein